uniref:Secreted protein n=1 Tax=Pyxicephalus adspersus TaxID=30357 RepID=A0AAV3AY29_PYXAD|nr:TPA: hypothetical protein GDO54_000081 [Pyxicephalus adspersus]
MLALYKSCLIILIVVEGASEVNLKHCTGMHQNPAFTTTQLPYTVLNDWHYQEPPSYTLSLEIATSPYTILRGSRAFGLGNH